MSESLHIVNKFVNIMAEADKTSERLLTEWQYLYTLLQSQPVAYDRIEAYLNILRQQGGGSRKSLGRRSTHADHPDTATLRQATDGALALMAQHDQSIGALVKSLGIEA